MGKQTDTKAAPLGWDDPLPEELMSQWKRWKEGLSALKDVSVPRCHHVKDFGIVGRAELHVFSDASQGAVAAAVYLRIFNQNRDVSTTLVYGQAKVAPTRPTSIPRLELCAAVMATKAAAMVLREIDMGISEVVYYTDSQVVLGYITNESRRFYVYVANRVQIIRSLSRPEQWRYIESEKNPADVGTRGVRPTELQQSSWLSGPDFLRTTDTIPLFQKIPIDNSDPELRKEIITVKTEIKDPKQRLGYWEI